MVMLEMPDLGCSHCDCPAIVPHCSPQHLCPGTSTCPTINDGIHECECDVGGE